MEEIKNMKVITICGSIKFKDEITKIAIQKELEGNIVFTPIFPLDNNTDILNREQLTMLGKIHKEKIKLSDAILVANVNGYIGSSTRSEIEYAKEQNKEILYLE